MFPTTLKRAALAGSFLLASALAPSLAYAAAAARPEPSTAATATTERAAVRDAIWKLEKSLRGRLAAAERGVRRGAVETSPTGRPRDPRERLDALRRAARRLGPAGADLARKTRVLEQLVDAVERRERAGASAQPASAWSVDGAGERLDAAAGASCGEAAGIGAGRFLVEVGGSGRPDVWLQHRSEVAGMLVVSTAGSEADTLVEVYDGCPAPGASPVAAGDDEIGLQARAARRVAAGETSWIRVSGWEGAHGTAVVAVVEGSSGFIGTVTREDNGHPVPYRYVDVWTSGGSYAGSARTDADGVYFFGGVSAGNYYAATEPPYTSDGLLEELYDDKPCPGGAPNGCNPTTGTPIAVGAGSILSGVDFALGAGGEVTGRVRDAVTGAALAYAEVSIYNAAGNHLDDVGTDVAGRYTLGGLGTGTVYAVANGGYGTQYRRELYYDIACGSYTCNVTTGTPIPVTIGQTTTGIDFSLDKLGAIAGTLTRVQDGTPISYGEVDIWDGQGNYVTWAYVNSSGQYLVGGLEPGNYFVRTYTGDFFDELYDNLPCSNGCAPTAGTPIAVTLNHTSSGIDFALRRNGSIAGAVTDASNGTPIASYTVYVSVFDHNGNVLDSGWANSGAYSFSGLDPGTYYVYAESEAYRSELYNDVPCINGPPSGCSFASGTPVVTQLDVPTNNINFALTRLGSIAGTISDQATAAPVNGGTVQVWNAAGTSVGYAYATSAGAYEVKGLPAGTYYVTAQSYEYLPELYNNLSCPGGGPPTCNPATGNPVSVSLGMTTNGINFTLTRKGTIAGTVRDLATGTLIYAGISVYNSSGTFVASATAYSGTYEVRGLDVGNYFVVAGSSGWSTRLYNGLPCPPGNCHPTAGTPVPVTLNATTGGIDFNLPRLGRISGTVTSDAGPLSGINVGLYDASGTQWTSVYTGSDGRYQLSADQGSWYVMAGLWSSDYVTELYLNLRCPNNSCNIASGTPVPVSLGATTPGIDFTLDASRGILGCVVNEAAQPLVGVAIDLWSPAGTRIATAVTGTNGCYRLTPNSAGTYFVSTDSGLPLVDEVWNDVLCPHGSAYAGLCDPTAGTPINLPNWDSLMTDVNFTLGVGRIFRNGFESGDASWIFWP